MTSFLKQPRAVWAVAFACVIAFMGIGLVDPILKPIADQLGATPSQVSLLFTSYMAVMGVAMLITGVVSTRIGAKRTLLSGLALIIVFSALAGLSDSIGAIVGFRAGWGLGNALFIATALATIVMSAHGGTAKAIILFEAALGLGIAAGPLLGGALGSITWRAPFLGVAVLMSIALVATTLLLPPTPPAPRRTTLADPFRALRHPGLLTIAITALFYNMGFFTLLAFTPFPLDMSAHQVGLIFFGWGLLLAITSVWVAPILQRRFGSVPTVLASLALFSVDLGVMALFTDSTTVLVVGVVVAGAFLGINNTVITEAVMGAAPVERPVASAAYSFVRFSGGAVAPWLAGRLGEDVSVHAVLDGCGVRRGGGAGARQRCSLPAGRGPVGGPQRRGGRGRAGRRRELRSAAPAPGRLRRGVPCGHAMRLLREGLRPDRDPVAVPPLPHEGELLRRCAAGRVMR